MISLKHFFTVAISLIFSVILLITKYKKRFYILKKMK